MRESKRWQALRFSAHPLSRLPEAGRRSAGARAVQPAPLGVSHFWGPEVGAHVLA